VQVLLLLTAGLFYFYAMEKVNLAEKLASFSDYFNPRIVGALNGQCVKLVKFKGEFVWHHHANEDELFYVVKGSFDMHLRDKVITVNTGEFLIMPKGVEHKPVAAEEVEIMLFEPATTVNTGNATDSDLTKTTLQTI
jgi:mannose-6-phosphate isomerase-like protein (cupin superfamily)